MTTLLNLIKLTNLKTLISTLRTTHQHTPMPFYVLKFNSRTLQLPDQSSLAINRQISDETLIKFRGPLTVWSPRHLQRIYEARVNTCSQRIILKNPYKSDQLLTEGLQMGVSEMVVDSKEEYFKIQSFLRNSSKFKNRRLVYHWSTENEPANMKDLMEIGHNIEGLFFGLQHSHSNTSIQQLTQRVIQSGVNLKHVICEGRAGQLAELSEWRKQVVQCGGRSIDKMIDVCELSEVDNYILATKTLCKKRTLISEQARQLIGGLECSEHSLLVEVENEQWLLSSVSTLPLEQDKYLFNIETVSQPSDLSQPKAIVIV